MEHWAWMQNMLSKRTHRSCPFLSLLENPDVNRHCSSRKPTIHPLFHTSLFTHDAKNKNARRGSIIHPLWGQQEAWPLPVKTGPHCGMIWEVARDISEPNGLFFFGKDSAASNSSLWRAKCVPDTLLGVGCWGWWVWFDAQKIKMLFQFSRSLQPRMGTDLKIWAMITLSNSCSPGRG